jgi:putative ABC transport system permease protein
MFSSWRDLRVARSRFLLVGAVIGLVALLTTLLSGLATGLVDDGISGLRSMPLTHLALQPGAESSFSRSTLNQENLAAWTGVEGVEAAPIGVSFFNAKASSGDRLDLAVFGVPPDSFLAPSPETQAAGLGEESTVVLNRSFEDEGVHVGDTITVLGSEATLTVVGFADSGSYGHVDIAFTSLTTWQHLLYGEGANGRFSAVAIRASDGTALDVLDAIDRTAGTETETKAQAYAGSPGYSAETATMNLIRGFLLLISALIVGAFFTVWTIQRTRQIGLLKALGASNGYVVRDALGQLAIVLVAATAVGAAIAVGLGSLVGSDVPFSLRPGPVLGSAVVLVVLGMAGSLVSLRRITSVDPAVALGTEH